ncbi:MAG TPA: NAD(P)H-binding protein, partial [Anaerolineae bacterium]|nr:NAD(P)H-binding protein [Anaerolineae bacterium]
MRLTVFGGSGRIGIPLINQALAAGQEVTALVRTPAKLAIQHERLHVLQGDALDAGQVAAAIAGADAVLSVLGQTHPPTKDLLTTAVGNMLAGMAANGVHRFVYLT